MNTPGNTETSAMIRYRSVTKLALACLLLALPWSARPTPAAAQEAAAIQQVRAGLPADSVRAFEAILAQAEQRGLPAEPLVNRALYGVRRNMPAGQILAVLRLDLDHLTRSRDIIGGRAAASADIVAVADALRQGVPESAVRAVARGGVRGDVSIALAVFTLGDLIDRGVPVEHGLALIEVWRARGRPAAELRELPAAVEQLIRQGSLPAAAADAVAEALRAGRGVARGRP